jgi:hypothetical protein
MRYLSQFNDNQQCARAIQMAIVHLDIEDDANLRMLRRIAYVTATAAQSVDDEVFICAMLHPLAEYKSSEDLAVLMTGLGYEALKVVQALRETADFTQLYDRVSELDPKYKAIVMARVMYRLLNIEMYEYAAAESIIEEAEKFTIKLDVPFDLMVQFEALLWHAKRVFSEIYAEELLEDSTDELEDVTDREMTTDDWEEFIEHKRLAADLDVVNKQVIELPGIGKVTYFEGAGFCTDRGELVTLNQSVKEDSTITPKKVNLLDSDYDYESMLHLEVAKSLGVIMDNQVTTLGDFGRVIFSEGIGFFNENAEMISLKGSVFEDILLRFPDKEEGGVA